MRVRSTIRPALKPPLAAMSDIAFQLIIFFMVTASFVNKDAVKIEMPASEGDSRLQTDAMPTIQANAEITLLDGVEVTTMDDLQVRLQERLTILPEAERVVILLTADDLPFQKNVELLATVQRAGGQPAIMMEDSDP